MSGGAEEFLTMRSTFTSSVAAASLTGYIAGSGDRHLDNFLLHLRSGALIPIDFGCVRLCFWETLTVT
jgi:DNA-dependent protein kinase catalytic subunit